MKNLFFLAAGLAGLSFARAAIEVKAKDDNHKFSVTCQSSDTSPLLHHVYEAADKIHTGPEANCHQSYLHPPYCTKLEDSDGARISICDSDGEDVKISCRLIADMTRALADNCSNGVEGEERASGYIEEWKLTVDGWKKTPAWIRIATLT